VPGLAVALEPAADRLAADVAQERREVMPPLEADADAACAVPGPRGRARVLTAICHRTPGSVFRRPADAVSPRAEVHGAEVPSVDLRPAEVRTDVGVRATPRVPGVHALLEQCDVIVVRDGSHPEGLRQVRCCGRW
jgi:hypothetical protein